MLIRERIQEMSLALIQVSVRCRRNELRQRLERMAFDLLECGNLENPDQVREKLNLLDGLVSFGKLIYEIEPMNAGILLAESERIKAGIRQSSGTSPDGSILSIFKSAVENQAKDRVPRKMRQSEPKLNAAIRVESDNNAAILRPLDVARGRQAQDELPVVEENNAANNTAIASIEKLSAEKNLLNDWANAAIRQSAIVERIRQSGNDGIKLRSIIAEFPGVSDRTVRYDLQKLCNQGILERIGPGGPASSYRIRVL